MVGYEVIDILGENIERLKGSFIGGTIGGGFFQGLSTSVEATIENLQEDGKLTPDEARRARERLEESDKLRQASEKVEECRIEFIREDFEDRKVVRTERYSSGRTEVLATSVYRNTTHEEAI